MSTDFRASKMPKIKPSHRGLLHEDLGIPKGQKIGEKRLEEAKHSSSPAIRKRANFALNFNDHGSHGYVTHIGNHERPGYAELTIAHGHRRKPKGEHGVFPSAHYDNRPTSRIAVPKKHAHQFHIGQHVGVGAIPLEGPDTDEMDEGEDVSGPGGDDDGDEDEYSHRDALEDLKTSVRRGVAKSKRRAS